MDAGKLTFILIIYCLTISNVAAEAATVVSNSSLYQRPSIQSSIIQQIEAGTTANIDSRLGGWKQISVNDISGWVRSYQVRAGNYSHIKQEKKSGGFFSGLASLSRKASGLFTSNNKKGYSFQNTATIGVRGLSEEQIKNAKADLNELKKMDTFRSSRKNTKKYAQQGHLKAIKVSHMPKSGAEQ